MEMFWGQGWNRNSSRNRLVNGSNGSSLAIDTVVFAIYHTDTLVSMLILLTPQSPSSKDKAW